MPSVHEAGKPLLGWGLALEKAPQFLSVLLLFILPFLTQLEAQDPLFFKSATTQILVYLMLGSWVLRAVLTGKIFWVSSKAAWVLVALVVWCSLSLLWSPYSTAGFLRLSDDLVYPLWYILLTFNCLEIWQAENLLITFLISGLGTILWALVQVAGWETGGWTEIVKAQFGGRPIAGLGSPDALAGFLLMVWPLSLALWMRAAQGITKGFWGFLTLASLFTFLLTGSLAGWFGFLAGALLFSTVILKNQGAKGLRWLFPIWTTFFIPFLVPTMSGAIRGFWGGSSLEFQSQVWDGTLGIIQQRPFGGMGYGTFEEAFPSHRPSFLTIHHVQEAYGIHHAQNWVLEWTSETGIIGLLILLAFWFYVVSQWWKLYVSKAIVPPLAAGFFAVLAGVAVDNLLEANGFTPTILMPLLFLAAFPVALSHRFYHLEGFLIRLKRADLSTRRAFLWPVLALVFLLVFQRVGDAFQRQNAEMELKRAVEATQAGKWDDALKFYDTALKFNPRSVPVLYGRGSVYFNRAQGNDVEKALEDFRAASRIDPDYQQLHFQLYKALTQLNRTPEAAVELKRAIQLDPMLIYLLNDFKKARMLSAARQFPEALIVYQNLDFDYPTCVPMLIDHANCFAMAGEYESALKLYRYVLQLDPGNEKALHNLQKVGVVWERARESQKPKMGMVGSELE